MKNLKNLEFFTIQEFADFIGVCYRTVYNAIKNGHIEAFRVGRSKNSHYRIPKSEITRLGIFNLDEVIINKINFILDKRERLKK